MFESLSDRLSGIFGDDNLKLGGVLAALAPLLLLPALARFGWRGFGVAATALLLVILLAGARAAWASYALDAASAGLVVLCQGLAFAVAFGISRMRGQGVA